MSELVRHTLEGYADYKRVSCTVNGGPIDAPPLLHVAFVNDSYAAAIIDGDPAVLIPQAIGEAREFGGSIRAVVLLTDAVSREGPPPPDFEPGQLIREWHETPAADLQEVLVALEVDVFGDIESWAVAYRYDDHGVPEFGPAAHCRELHNPYRDLIVGLLRP